MPTATASSIGEETVSRRRTGSIELSHTIYAEMVLAGNLTRVMPGIGRDRVRDHQARRAAA